MQKKSSVFLTLFITGFLWLASPVVRADAGYYESEPNDTPADANPISGAVTVYGTMLSDDQDGFLWTVTDDDARKRWNFELYGIPGALTIADVVRVEYAENGQDVAAALDTIEQHRVTLAVFVTRLHDPHVVVLVVDRVRRGGLQTATVHGAPAIAGRVGNRQAAKREARE